MSRVLFIGDVHGCVDELARLLEACGHGDGDEVVLVGDLVAKGPDSLGVISLVRGLPRARCVRGNHDEAVLRVRAALEAGKEPPPRAKKTHRDVAAGLSSADYAFLNALPLWVELPEHASLVVHAGLVPGVPLAAQRPEDLLTMRSLRADGTATKRLEEGTPWARSWPGPTHVVFGHDAVRGLQRYEHAVGIDTGCVYGRTLTAWIMPERRLVSVPARRVYADAMGPEGA